MAERLIACAKLGQQLPGLDETTAEGQRALKMALLLGGPALRERVHEQISAQAWALWKERMLLVMNEYRLDATSDESNAILRQHLEEFLFGTGAAVRNYVPPASG